MVGQNLTTGNLEISPDSRPLLRIQKLRPLEYPKDPGDLEQPEGDHLLANLQVLGMGIEAAD